MAHSKGCVTAWLEAAIRTKTEAKEERVIQGLVPKAEQSQKKSQKKKNVQIG